MDARFQYFLKTKSHIMAKLVSIWSSNYNDQSYLILFMWHNQTRKIQDYCKNSVIPCSSFLIYK